MENQKINIQTSDDKVFQMDKSDAMEIVLIRTQMEDEELKDKVSLDIEYEQLKKVIEFIHQCQTKPYKTPLPKPLPSDQIEDVLDQKWYVDFIDLPKNDLLKLIKAANYLNVERLFELASAKLGSNLKGMNMEMLRQYFEIANDLTDE